jgi:hypothetical protein
MDFKGGTKITSKEFVKSVLTILGSEVEEYEDYSVTVKERVI